MWPTGSRIRREVVYSRSLGVGGGSWLTPGFPFTLGVPALAQLWKEEGPAAGSLSYNTASNPQSRLQNTSYSCPSP